MRRVGTLFVLTRLDINMADAIRVGTKTCPPY